MVFARNFDETQSRSPFENSGFYTFNVDFLPLRASKFNFESGEVPLLMSGPANRVPRSRKDFCHVDASD